MISRDADANEGKGLTEPMQTRHRHHGPLVRQANSVHAVQHELLEAFATEFAIRAQIAVLHGKFTGSRFLSEPKRRLSQENPSAPERLLAAQPAIAARAE